MGAEWLRLGVVAACVVVVCGRVGEYSVLRTVLLPWQTAYSYVAAPSRTSR